MIIFNVVEQSHGWAIRMNQGTSTHFRSRDLAIREANALAEGLKRHGASTRVIVQESEALGQPCRIDVLSIDKTSLECPSLGAS